MIEIVEIDHALDLARNRAEHGLKAEARKRFRCSSMSWSMQRPMIRIGC